MINIIRSDFVKYDTYNRIIKNISNYKRNELLQLLQKMGIEPTNKSTKQDIFDIVNNI